MAVKFEPRSYLVDPTRFGRDLTAAWRSFEGIDAPQVAAALLQHQVACGVRDRMAETADTLDTLAARAATAPETLGRKLTGVVPARIDDLYALVFAYGDVTLMPAPSSIADLLPGLGADR